MIRNAWHISGGKGWCANSSNKRVLVTRSDGTQSVEEIKNDLGLKTDDKAGMTRRLKAQGVEVTGISTDGAVEDIKATKSWQKAHAATRVQSEATTTSTLRPASQVCNFGGYRLTYSELC